MKLLILATDYPKPSGQVSLQYIHTRNKAYVKNNFDVSVISFNSQTDYTIDGVKVYTKDTFENKLRNEKYDLLISHAPNIREHYRFLKKYIGDFENVIFFFHGHEVLKTLSVYPEPYKFVKKAGFIFTLVREIYDIFKLKIWKNYFNKISNKSQFVFVSQWMYDMFIKHTQIDPVLLSNRKHIIYNSVGEVFEKCKYEFESEKKFDFITIRNYLDGSKYAIDIVTKIARLNPQYKFCVVGQGKFYKYNQKPDNLEWIDKSLSHGEIISFLNISKYALMPTRTDAQGVMMCEMATFGIPVITSNVDICKEVFHDFNNVEFIDNSEEHIIIKPIIEKFKIKNHQTKKNLKYFEENTIGKEMQLFRNLRG